MNIVETNNDFTGNLEFQQIWPSFIPADLLPEEPPALETAYKVLKVLNSDKTLLYKYFFQKETPNGTWDILEYRQNFLLKKVYRQGKVWAFPEEEDLRDLIFPSMTQSRVWSPTFTDGTDEVPYTSLNPVVNLKDCNLTTTLDLDSIYINCWLYRGKKLDSKLESFELPFDDKLWLLKGQDSLARFETAPGEKVVYKLPSENLNPQGVLENKNLVVTNSNINLVLNTIGHLDEGEYW